MTNTCSIDGCEKPAAQRGWCPMHYQRWRTRGTHDARVIPTVHDRIQASIELDEATGCWLWTGAMRPDGYGYLSIENRKLRAHRVVYELQVGPIPRGLELDHLCRVLACVNPEHLEPVTHAINVARGQSLVAANALKTHCDHGHEFTEENTYWRLGWRHCKACHREAERRQRAQRDARKRKAS